MELLEHEKKHIDYLKSNAAECALFLKRNDAFPIDKPCSLVLVGNGGKMTVKGGTGSGDVASRFFVNCFDAFKQEGFTITSEKWFDEYETKYLENEKKHIKETKKTARKAHILSMVFQMGYFPLEPEHQISNDYDGDICVYVLSRNSGEGNDRRNLKGDVKLTDSEVRDILALNNKFEKFMLVLNVGGVVDLSPVMEVSNILLLSQLGVVTSNVLVDIILGKANPTGKLSTTWAKSEDYPFFNEFGDIDDTYYKEGIYVGYRYFDTNNVKPLFPFGYGVSYSSFNTSIQEVNLIKNQVSIDAFVENTSNTLGKEVVQVYLSKPQGTLDQPYQQLCAYKKTNHLNGGEGEQIHLSFNLDECASYNTELACYVLEKGDYVVRVGNASNNTTPAMVITIKEDVIVSKLNNKCGSPNFKDYIPQYNNNEEVNAPRFEFDATCIETKNATYQKDEYVDEYLNQLSDEDLAYICLGHHKTGFAAIVGSSCEHVVGGAGETVLRIPQIDKSLTMADGPAGIRIKQAYGIDKKGIYDIVSDPMSVQMAKYLPKFMEKYFTPPKNRHGEEHYQFTTAIPIGTALAQSFNDEFVSSCGDLVAEEMEMFNVDLWLAPALNIHRNILCGRNFEYYSEDPYLSGKIAAAMSKGVQKHSNRGVTIKHFACNNQELNRNNNNSHISERALREIYLKGFEICIKDSSPLAIMTSYNLINGVHASENYELLNDILRCEWGYNGLIMTDWIASGRSFCKASYYKAPYASNNILAGNDLTMSGCPADFKDISKALKSGKLTRQDLLHSASRVYRSILAQKQ